MNQEGWVTSVTLSHSGPTSGEVSRSSTTCLLSESTTRRRQSLMCYHHVFPAVLLTASSSRIGLLKLLGLGGVRGRLADRAVVQRVGGEVLGREGGRRGHQGTVH